jgi:DNA-binding transcriptional ArsR family regulator
MPVTADVFAVLADPTRRRLIEALRVGEHSVTELVERAGINQPGVSKQLRILHDAGFVAVRPERQRRLYSLRAEPFRALDAWIDDYRHLWEARFDRLAARLEARTPPPDEQTTQMTRKESDTQP